MAAGTQEPAHRPIVLIVEDGDDERAALALLLEVNGHRAVAVPNAVEALQVMLTLGLRPCVVVADLLLKGIDGLVLHEAMKRYPEIARIPTVALTGHEGMRRKAVGAGFAAALLKPCAGDVLFETLDRCCKRALLARRA